MTGMKQLSFLLAPLLVAVSASAITTERPPRIALLDLAPRYEMQVDAFGTMRDSLREALKQHGFDVFTTADRYDDLARSNDGHAEYYVEIVGTDREARVNGGGDVAVGALAVGVSSVKHRELVELRLYDGKTLDVIRTYQLDASSNSLVPTAIGLRSCNFFFSLFLSPWTERAPARRAIHAVAREAARRITADAAEYQLYQHNR
jgi:hypothetical protein